MRNIDKKQKIESKVKRDDSNLIIKSKLISEIKLKVI